MAVPFRRTSKTKKRMRRTHLKKEVPTVSLCPKCNAPIKPHRVCLKCGFYKGNEAIKLNAKEEVKETKEVKAPKVKAKAAPKAKETKTKKEDTK